MRIQKITHMRVLAIDPDDLPGLRAALDRALDRIEHDQGVLATTSDGGTTLPRWTALEEDRKQLDALRMAVHEDYG